MNKLPVSMILCAMLGATTTFGQAQTTFKGTVYQPTSAKGAEVVNTPQWEMIKEEDIAWKKRVWRTVDLSDKGNELLTLTSVHPSIGDVLLNGVYNTAYKTYTTYKDDRFTELSGSDIETLKASGISGDKITSLKIKEDWIMLKKDNKMVVRIVAMAPVIKSAEGAEKTAFWVYYPEARSFLAKQRVAAPGRGPGNLDDVFEGRFFTSKIEKVSGGGPLVEPGGSVK